MSSRKSIVQRVLSLTNSRGQILLSKNLLTRFTYLKPSSDPALRRCTPKSGKSSNEKLSEAFPCVHSVAGCYFRDWHRTGAAGATRDITDSWQPIHVGRCRWEHRFVGWTRRCIGSRYWNCSEFGSCTCSH